MGFEAPREVRAPVPITYASCLFPRPASPPPWGALLYGAPGARRVGSVFPVEGGRWLATLAGFFDEPAPESHEAFLAFARALPIPDVHEALRGLEPLSPVARYRFAGGLRRRYDRLRRLPEGLVVTGDALCSFNPVYGQGMSVSAIEAERLGAALDGARRAGGLGADFGPRWFKAVRPAIDLAWEGTLLEDLHHPEVRDHASARLRLLQGYLGRVHRATHRCGRVTEQFYRVVNFLDPPSALLRPRILAAVALRGGRP
jgi:2-polyprenyl-6-methoxyphenol hydroxylase-like FAD-dependent oxidoreductase